MPKIKVEPILDVAFRPATADDEDALWEFLAIASFESSAASAQEVPVVAAHLTGWPRADDFGVIAEDRHLPIGAAWARQFTTEEGPAFHFGSKIPEISIAVRPEFRNHGVGNALLFQLEIEARKRLLDGLCLNVRAENRAAGLYFRVGYEFVAEAAMKNRVGSCSRAMVKVFNRN